MFLMEYRLEKGEIFFGASNFYFRPTEDAYTSNVCIL